MALPRSPYLASSSSYTPSGSLFSTPSTMLSGGGGASMRSYQERARDLLRRAGAHHGGGGAMELHSPKKDGIGDVVHDNLKPAVASLAFGAMDASELGKSFEKYIMGVAKPSTVAFVLGLGMRAANWDKAHPRLRGANNVLLRSMFPVLGYRLGERLVGGSLFKELKGKLSMKPSAPAPGKPAAAKPRTAGVEQPIPGERTTA